MAEVATVCICWFCKQFAWNTLYHSRYTVWNRAVLVDMSQHHCLHSQYESLFAILLCKVFKLVDHLSIATYFSSSFELSESSRSWLTCSINPNAVYNGDCRILLAMACTTASDAVSKVAARVCRHTHHLHLNCTDKVLQNDALQVQLKQELTAAVTWSMYPEMRESRIRETSSCSTSPSGMLSSLDTKGMRILV